MSLIAHIVSDTAPTAHITLISDDGILDVEAADRLLNAEGYQRLAVWTHSNNEWQAPVQSL